MLIYGFCTLSIYSNIINAPFYLDDMPRIKDNPCIRIDTLGFQQLKTAIFNPFSLPERPISNISFAINYYFNQYNPSGYHIVNIIIHCITGFLLFVLIKQLFRISIKAEDSLFNSTMDNYTTYAFLAALIWVVHPLHTNSVTYIIQRMNSMASMFFIAAFLFYVNGRLLVKPTSVDASTIKKPYLWFAGAACAWLLSLGCKETTIVLPLVILVFEFYFFQNLSIRRLKCKLRYPVSIGIILIVVAFIFLGSDPIQKISTFNDFSKNSFTLKERVITQIRVVIYYISLLFYPNPSRLNLDYDYPLSCSVSEPFVTLVALFTIIAIMFFSCYIAKRNRLLSFCLLWYFMNLIIESSVIPLAIIFEHRTYQPSMTFGLLLVILINSLVKNQYITTIVIVIIVICFSSWTYQRNEIWSDKGFFVEDSVQKSPNKARPHIDAGVWFADSGKTEKALKNYYKAIQLQPDYAKAYYNLGVLFNDIGDAGKAHQNYSKAIQLDSNYARAYYNSGRLFYNEGKADNAIWHYKKAVGLNPYLAEAHNNLGILYAEKGAVDMALKHYNRALKINPNYSDAYSNAGLLLFSIGKTDAAIRYLQKALTISPKSEEIHYSFGKVMEGCGKSDRALTHYKKAINANPKYVRAYINSGSILARKGMLKKAIPYFETAIQIQPGYAEAHNNIGSALTGLGKFQKALLHFNKAIEIQPDYTDAYNSRGFLFYRQNDFRSAAQNFRKALSLDPERLDIQQNLKRVLDKLEKK